MSITDIGPRPQAFNLETDTLAQHHKPDRVHQSKATADTDDAPVDWSNQPGPVDDQHA